MSEVLEKNIPEGWDKIILGDYTISYAGGTPSRDNPEFYGGNIPWVSSGEVNQNYINETNEYITQKGLKFSSAKMILKNSILLALYGATAGQVSKLLINATANQAVLAINGNSELLNDYLYYCLNFNKDKILYLAQGSGQPNLSKALVDKFKVLMPEDIKEQEKIAEILSTVDNAIEKTEQIIDKYKNIKTGMMQDLFTRGIDENGKLRPTYEQAPELYKETELGWIPKDWDVDTLFNISTYVGRGKSPQYCEKNQGYEVLNQACIYWDGIKVNNTKFLTKKFWESLTEVKKAKKGDILINSTGTGTLGRIAYFDLDREYSYDSHVTLVRLKENYCSNYFYYYFCIEQFQKQIDIYCVTGSTNQIELSKSNLEEQLVIMAPPKEQETVNQKLNQIDDKITKEKDHLEKLKQIKLGLMQDLLTGKVRVKLEQEAIA